jgi:hypothetical protein
MKELLLFIFICTTLLNAQETTLNSISSQNNSDTLKISQLVEKQIQSAREKQLQSRLSNDHSVSQSIVVNEKQNIKKVRVVSGYSFIQNQPLHIQLFAMCSIAVIIFVLTRRLGFIIRRKSQIALKGKIQMLREEKITYSPRNNLHNSRRNLQKSDLALRGSEKQISRTAKDMKIAKGELILAAKLRLFEIGRI